MADVKKCDRCGDVYDKDNFVLYVGTDWNDKDLCPHCKLMFECWWDEGKEEAMTTDG